MRLANSVAAAAPPGVRKLQVGEAPIREIVRRTVPSIVRLRPRLFHRAQKANEKRLAGCVPNLSSDYPIERDVTCAAAGGADASSLVIDGDFLQRIALGRCVHVHDEIESFTPDRHQLKSGKILDCDIIATFHATRTAGLP